QVFADEGGVDLPRDHPPADEVRLDRLDAAARQVEVVGAGAAVAGGALHLDAVGGVAAERDDDVVVEPALVLVFDGGVVDVEVGPDRGLAGRVGGGGGDREGEIDPSRSGGAAHGGLLTGEMRLRIGYAVPPDRADRTAAAWSKRASSCSRRRGTAKRPWRSAQSRPSRSRRTRPATAAVSAAAPRST